MSEYKEEVEFGNDSEVEGATGVSSHERSDNAVAADRPKRGRPAGRGSVASVTRGASDVVFVGCRLPHGLVLDFDGVDTVVTLKGVRESLIVGADYCVTEVDGEFWGKWKERNYKHPCLVSGAIFEAKNSAEAFERAVELKQEKTGFEPMPREAPGLSPRKD